MSHIPAPPLLTPSGNFDTFQVGGGSSVPLPASDYSIVNKFYVDNTLATGYVQAPASSVTNTIALFADSTGHLLSDSTLLVTSGNQISNISSVSLIGTGSVTISANPTSGTYSLVLPPAQGAPSTFLQNDGSGILNWATPGGAGNVTGPLSSTINAIALYFNTTGTVIKNSTILVSSTSDITGVASLALKGTTNSVTISPAAATAAYPLTLPAAQGAASTYLQNSGTGVLTWVTDTGYVTGPASSTNTALALYSGTTGKIIQNSTVTVSSVGAVAGVASLALKGTTNSVTISPAAATAAYPLTLPDAQGGASTFLQNNGSGTLTWVSGNTGNVVGPASATDTALALYSGTTGKIIQNSTVTVSSVGAVAGVASMALKGTTNSVTISPAAATAAYPLTLPDAQGVASTFLQNNGSGTLSWATPAGVGNSDYMVGNLANTVSTNLSTGNHAPFNQAYQSSNGTASTTNITLDTTSPYSTGTNTASIGRITLKANLAYTIMGIVKSLAGVDYYGYCWFNSDTNTRIGTRGEGFASTSQGSSASSNPSYCTLTPSVDTRIELRLTESSIGLLTNWYAGSTGYGETMFSIITANAASASNSFTGATASVSGTQGLVPAPAAGKQLSFLRGDATWQTALTGPVSSTNTAIATFNGTSGSAVQSSGVTVSATQDLAGVKTLALAGTTNSVTISPASATAAYPLTLPAAQGTASTYLQNSGTGVLTWVTDTGYVTGPASSTNTALALYSGTTGKIIQNSTVTVSSVGAVAGVASLALKGTTNSVTISPDAATVAYPLTLPAAQGAASTFLQNNGSGTLTWAAAAAVSSVYFRSYNNGTASVNTIQTFVTTGTNAWLTVAGLTQRLTIGDSVQQQGGFTNNTNNVTIPTTGVYQISLITNSIIASSPSTTWGQIVKTVGVSTSVLNASGVTAASNASLNISLAYLGSFNAGDIVDFRFDSSALSVFLNLTAYSLSIIQVK